MQYAPTKNKISAINCFLLDMDGTLYLGERVIPGAVAFVKKVRGQGKRTVFISNNSSKNCGQYLEKLRQLGFAAEKDDIFTSLTATIIFLKEHFLKRIYPLGTPGFVDELVASGFKITAKSPDVVLLGFDTTLTYAKINSAYQLLRAGVPFIATHPDIVCPTETGFIPDAGGFIAMFRKLTGIAPRIIGKPYPTMIRSALHRYGVQRSEAAIIGDRLYTDMRMGKRSGILSILVLSGETKSLSGSRVHPDLVVSHIGALLPYL